MIRLPGTLKKALKISHWLKERGYKHQEDYIWQQDSARRQVIFVCTDPKLETLIALKWL